MFHNYSANNVNFNCRLYLPSTSSEFFGRGATSNVSLSSLLKNVNVNSLKFRGENETTDDEKNVNEFSLLSLCSTICFSIFHSHRSRRLVCSRLIIYYLQTLSKNDVKKKTRSRKNCEKMFLILRRKGRAKSFLKLSLTTTQFYSIKMLIFPSK